MPDDEEALDHPVFSRAEIASIMVGLLLSMFLASLDQTIVATALSSIAQDLQGWESMAWVVTAYLITSTVTTPIHGRLSDLYGRRPMLLLSIGLFIGASILCALAQTMPQLIAARALQGLGGGGLRSVTQAVVADIIPPRERGRYQGYFSGVFSISSVMGPVLGGFFSEYLSWTWIFWINVPFGLVAFALSSHQLARLQKPSRRAAIDWGGALLILGSTTPILFGVGNAERSGGWTSPEALGPILFGLFLVVVLLVWEARVKEPMLPLRLFRSGVFALSNLLAFFASAAMIGLVILLPINYQLAAGLSANEAGIRVIPLTLGSVLGSGIAGWLVGRTGRYRIFPILGTAISALCCAAIAWFGLGTSVAFDAVVTSVLGLAYGGLFSPLAVSVQNSLQWQDTGIGVSVLLFFRLIGAAFGVALLSTILIGQLAAGALAVPGHEALGANPGLALFHLDEPGTHLSPALLTALSDTIRHAFSRVFLVSAVIMAFGVLFALGLKDAPLRER